MFWLGVRQRTQESTDEYKTLRVFKRKAFFITKYVYKRLIMLCVAGGRSLVRTWW